MKKTFKKDSIIPVEDGLAVLIDRNQKCHFGYNYVLNPINNSHIIKLLPDNHSAYSHRIDIFEIVATIGRYLEGVPLIVLNKKNELKDLESLPIKITLLYENVGGAHLVHHSWVNEDVWVPKLADVDNNTIEPLKVSYKEQKSIRI
jgi:hypothetical protein